MLDLPPLFAAAVLLVIPDFGVNTGEAYAALAAHRAAGQSRVGATWRSPRSLGSWSAVAADAVNDFEPVVFAQHPSLATVRAQLAGLPQTLLALMSGSGSTLFAVQAQGTPPTLRPLVLPAGWTSLLTSTAPAAPIELT